MKKRKMTILIIVLTIVSLVLVSCGPSEEDTHLLSLKVGLMPAVDSAPFLLAEKNGYFEELGLDVELQLFNNPQDRQSALQTNSIDGAMSDLVAVALNVDGGFPLKITTMTNGVFPVLSNKNAKDKTDIKAVLMEVSVTNFLTDEYLGNRFRVEKVYINDIPARLAALQNRQVDMGIFPEPLASMGELSGLSKTLIETADGECPDVMVFTEAALTKKKDAIGLFHQAYNKAVVDLEENPDLARDILMEKIPGLKPEIKDQIILPKYTNTSLPSDAYIESIILWTSDVMQKNIDVTVEDLIDREYVEQ